MNQKYYQINIEGELINIDLSNHSLKRCEERGISKYEIYSLILKLGENLLDLRNGEQFAIVDKETGVGIVNQITAEYGEIFITVITAIHNDNIWISKGTKVLNVNEVYECIA
ncbi:hypothetical protein [Senegalia massiliensis]|uniref:Uncharacterized protein n=1 Tax=Senegalia massiliensis TaxID=1720316 RepID=A0A845R254_9CLOT|nr:hypothetical protein [Senegalia massiliensis]NBI07628.1 hypothetical protein [Senegalia massiliensis]